VKYINTIDHRNIKITLFPDNQPHVDLENIEYEDEVTVKIRLATSNDVMHLLQISDALDRLGAIKRRLYIPYLMGARYDRSMRKGDSFDLKVIAKLINSCGFKQVQLLDVHSPTSLALIDNSVSIDNSILVKSYNKQGAVLICPDTGAASKIDDYLLWNKNIIKVVYCTKRRDLDTGKIDLQVMESQWCNMANCVIIDDICDGGATFLAIADQIMPATLTLIVTHGIFSKGTKHLTDRFDQIITTDSYKDHQPSPKLQVTFV
jgi:ribose-phosphate pyrophosphokinase